jgi:pseudouridine-5'-phosphate glycosidase
MRRLVSRLVSWFFSMNPSLLEIRPEVLSAVEVKRPLVALESTLIAHGLPWPINLETARAAEAVVRENGATPATIAVLKGRPTVGLSDRELEWLANAKNVRKAARRDLAVAMAQKADAATTVSATMALAHRAGLAILATGGIGGVHRHSTWDVSADLIELSRTPVAVVCAGAKSILDLAATLEVLESFAVPVVGFRTAEFPAFYLRSSGEPVSAQVESAAEAAQLMNAHWVLGGAGLVLAQSLPAEEALEEMELTEALLEAENQAKEQLVRGAALTPFLLSRLAQLTDGRTLRANQELIVANARLAAQVAVALASTPAERH